MQPIPNAVQVGKAVTEMELATRAVAPRVSQADVDAAIRCVEYHVFPGTMLTVCVATLHNGYVVTGESACASPENFQRDIGERIARENAIRKVWPLLGFLLCERLHGNGHGQFPAENIARVCHEVNRAYCQALGDDSQPEWVNAPEWQRSSARMGVDLHMMGNFGPEASHVSWMRQKLAEGWKHGATKDADAKTHPCILPFDQLPRDQQAKDFIFRAVVHALR